MKRRPKPRIAIVGGNFAGLSAAASLGATFDVSVIDSKAAFEWLPNIHEIISGVKQRATLRLPLGERCRSESHRFVHARATTIDAANGAVELNNGKQVRFDFCIIAVGGVNDTLGVPGADRYALPFKSVDECLAIRRRLNELASTSSTFDVVIIGGGLEGIEALGEVLRRFRNHRNLTIHLVEGGHRLLPEGPAGVDAAIRQHLEALPVSLSTAERVAKVTPRSVVLASGRRLRSDITIWTGGARPPRLLLESGLTSSEGSWAPVRPTLLSKAFDNVFVAGDAAYLSRPVAKQAYHAIDMGCCAAENVARLLSGKKLQPFQPSPKPMLLAFGDLDTFLITGSRLIASPLLAGAKEVVFQATMARLDPPQNRHALARLQARARQGLARLLPTRGDACGDLARLFSVRIDAL